MADSNLPPGWIILSDPATSTPYYYNQQTFASSWEHPGHGSPSFNPGASSSRSPYYPNTTPSVRSQYSTRSSEWDEYFDEAANAPYYINRNTQETAWERPRMSPVKHRTPLQPVSHNNTPYSGGIASPNKGMHMGGSPYMSQTSPAGIASSRADMSPNYSGAASTGPGAGVQPLNLPHPWQEFWDADSATPYYVNQITNESSWERPTSQSFHQEYNPALEAPHSGASPEQDSHHHLRHAKTWGAWEELFDYDNNSHYYYNSSTQESLWEPPQGWPLGSAGGGLNTSGFQPSPLKTPRRTTSVSPFPLTANNANTPNTVGTNRTERSGVGGLVSPSPSVAPQQSVAGLVSNSPVKRQRSALGSSDGGKKWSKEYDHQSGSFYFVNTSTNESQWERPPSLPATARGTGRTPLTPASANANNVSQATAERVANSSSVWESNLDEVTGERFYTNKLTGEAQWEAPEGFVEPKSLFQELKKLDKPQSAASSLLAQMKGEKREGYEEMLNFSTAANEDELKKHRERETKRLNQQEDAVAAGMYEGGALSMIMRQKRAAEMLQKYVRGRKARREMRQRIKEKDQWVKENAKKTGAYDDVFDRLRSRGAKIRSIESWEQWLDSSGRIFYYNPMDARGQWVPPLCFERILTVEGKSEMSGRTKALKEDAAMRKLERNWENRTDVEVKWDKLEKIQKDKMETTWKGNSWMRGFDSLRNQDSYSRDALEVESYRYVYNNLKRSELKIDSEFEEAERLAKERKERIRALEGVEEEELDGDELEAIHDMKEVEADGKIYEPRKERFINTVSRGVMDVNDPDMLRRAFVLRRGWGKCKEWMQLADPLTGFKLYKNTIKYTFQWEKPRAWDSGEEEKGEWDGESRGDNRRRNSRRRSKAPMDESSERVATPQKIVLGIIGKNPNDQTIKLSRTRLNVQHYDPSGDSFFADADAQGKPSSNTMSLTNLIERASAKTFYAPPGREGGWLRDTVMEMYLDTQTQSRRGGKEHATTKLPPVNRKSKRQHFMGGVHGADRSASGEFGKCVKELQREKEAAADEEDKEGPLYGESLAAAMRYLEALPSVNTPRMALKMKRRTKGGSGATQKRDSPFPFSHPSIHALSPSLVSITNFARAYLLHAKILKRDLSALLSADRASRLSTTQFFDPTPTPHRMNIERDRLMSYCIPGGTSMVRSDTTLGAGPHATQRLVQLRDLGVRIHEVILDERDDASSEWVILMNKKNLWGGRSLPQLIFDPRRVEGAIDPGFYRGGKNKIVNPPPPPPKSSNPSSVKEVYFLNKKSYTCQPGIPSSLIKEYVSEDWKRTGRIARVGFGRGETDYEQYVNSKRVVMYRAKNEGDGNSDDGGSGDDEESAKEKKEQELVRIDPLGRIVYDESLEEGLKGAFMRLNDLKGGEDVVATAVEISKLCRHRQFRHAERALRAVNEVIGIDIEAEGEEKVDGVEDNLDDEMVHLAAAITVQVWWRGTKQRKFLSGRALAEKVKGKDAVVEEIVTASGNKVLMVRGQSQSMNEVGVGGQNLMSDFGEESAVSLSLDPDIAVLVDSVFDFLLEDGKTTIPQLKVLTTINVLKGGGTGALEGGETLEKLGALLPEENSPEMDDLFRNVDETPKFDRFLFRNLFAYTNKLMKKRRRRKEGGLEGAGVTVDVSAGPGAEKTHVDYAMSSRLSIARAWALVAAGDSVAASRAANTALQHVLKGSKMASQIGYDVEALILLSELLGVGLGDVVGQGNILTVCVRSHPDNISVLNACGTFFVNHIDVFSLTDSFCTNAVKFLGRCVSTADRAAQEAAAGKGFMAYERAVGLYNLASFELAHNHTNFQGEIWEELGRKDGDVYTVPLVSIERKARQAISLLSPGIERRGTEGKVLYSKLHFLLGKILHTYKGCGSSNTARYSRNEALRMYEVAAVWGSRSLSVAEGFELDVSIGIHKACLLFNEGRIVESEDVFLATLYGEKHYVGPKSCGAWLAFGAFLERRGDLEGSLGAYDVAVKMSSKAEAAVVGLLAQSQLEELVRADTEQGFKHLQSALASGRKSGNVAVLVAAAQYSSEVDGDVVTAAQLLERALGTNPGYGPALRWQGLLLARAGHYELAVSKLKESCRWSALGKLYSPGIRCHALMTLSVALEEDARLAREGKGEQGLKASRVVPMVKQALARVACAEPSCRLTSLCCALLHLSYLNNPKRAESFLLSACRRQQQDSSQNPKFGYAPGEAFDPPPAEALRTLARLYDSRGDKIAAVQTWKRCLTLYPGDRMSLSGLATTLWGILKTGHSGIMEGELTALGTDLLSNFQFDLSASIAELFAASVSTSPSPNLKCTGPVPPECHALYASYLQDELSDYRSSHPQLSKACKAWKVSLESRPPNSFGLFSGSSTSVPATALYRLGLCAEAEHDLAAAEKFFTWALEVPCAGGHDKSCLEVVTGWAERDEGRCRRRYQGLKRRRRRYLSRAGGKGTEDEELALEEGLAFAARCYMLRSRVAKFARMRVVEVGGGEVGRDWAAAVERGWEGRMLGKFASRDRWTCCL